MRCDSWLNIKNRSPVIDAPVYIKTNWRSYLARLKKSEFGGVEFHVSDSTHIVQLTTVTGWKAAV